MRQNEFYRIPKEKLEEGIEKCYRKIIRIINSLHIRRYGDNTISLGLYSFAIEEFGKLLCLIEKYQDDKQLYFIPKNLFTGQKSHKIKFEKARLNLDQKCLKPIFGFFGVPLDGKNFKITTHRGQKITINPKNLYHPIHEDFDLQTRMACFYLDWNEKREDWKNEPYVLGEGFDEAVFEFKKTVDKKICELNDSKTS